MPVSVALLPSPAEPDWLAAARLCRRICTLAERGEIAEADRLRTGEFAAAVAALQGGAALDAAFAREAERLALATILAEQLAPLLAARLAPTAAVAAPAAVPAAVAVTKAAPTSPPAGANPRRATSPNDIAGFIDEMLALDRRAS